MTVAYCLLDATGRVLAADGEHDVFYAASTIKLAVMAAAAHAVDAGELSWSTPLPQPVRSLVMDMIARSSNEATNVVAARLGLAAISRVLADAGADGCRMERLIGDEAATAAGLTNEVTPLGLARLLHAIVTGRLTSPESREVMLEALRAQEFAVIGDEVRPGVGWGSKSGWVDGIDHDVAFVGSPDGDFVVLAVCTSGFAGREGLGEIRRVAASVLPRRLARDPAR
ncbi:serine hydrolase [Gryllotalpicola daejeonensis]|uniref:Serine hydrolase n=1 Tax=Gryllotalpicola daejeonensis TaxID=993087 RepID=A0ABP7ZIY3_9MICO